MIERNISSDREQNQGTSTKRLVFYRIFKSIILIYIFLLSLTTKSIAQPIERPNFIFFIVDDVGWRDIGSYSNTIVQTPNIDRLAASGLQFENAYLTTSSCSPSRSSIITGRYPHNTGAPELHDPLPSNQIMFPELLRNAGYYTVLSGKNHMGPHTVDAFNKISKGKGPGGEEDWVSIIQERPRDKPFFFWFASFDAHRDWQLDENGVTYNPDAIQVPPMLYDGPETRKDLTGYYHEISRIDYFLGEIIEELKSQKLLDHTYIIFMSDNGSPFPRNKARLYDSGIKTPLIISGPHIKPGNMTHLISAIDIAPTILELSGIETIDNIQGLSFHELLENPQKPKLRDFVFAEHNWHVFQAHERMVRYQDWVYIRNAYPQRGNYAAESTRNFPAGNELWAAYEQGLTRPEQEDIFLMPRESEELYHVASDPHQFHNLAGGATYSEILELLRGVLNQWINDTGDSIPEEPTRDRDDIYGNRLPGKWEKGEKAGANMNAESVNSPGPITKNDIQYNFQQLDSFTNHHSSQTIKQTE